MEVKAQSTDVGAHDPVMTKQDSTYCVFTTGWGISVKSSENMENWVPLSPVVDEPPEWTTEVVDDFRDHIWAPDIAKHNGTYYLYYSVSRFGTNNSAIGVATNKTLDSRHRYWKLNELDAGNSSSGDIEAPFIFKNNGYCYLFASWNQCCSGKEST